MTPTHGRKPRTGDRPLRPMFRNGWVARFPLPASKWRWTDTASDWDIVSVERA